MDDYKELVAKLKSIAAKHNRDPLLMGIAFKMLEATEAIESQAREIERLSAEKAEVICIAHRDGGHYIAQHGMEKAFTDALTAIYTWRTAFDELAELKSASAEPVAWMTKQGGWVRITDDPKNPDGYDIPLYTAPVAVQEGWQLVPKEPTEEMLAALDEHGMCYDYCNNSWFEPLEAYVGMLAAAPNPTVQEDAKDAALKKGETK